MNTDKSQIYPNKKKNSLPCHVVIQKNAELTNSSYLQLFSVNKPKT